MFIVQNLQQKEVTKVHHVLIAESLKNKQKKKKYKKYKKTPNRLHVPKPLCSFSLLRLGEKNPIVTNPNRKVWKHYTLFI